jgi:hypothetical protein
MPTDNNKKEQPKDNSQEMERILTGALAGAGVGGVGKAIHSFLQGKDLTSIIRSALTGAGMGAAAGGGIGYLTGAPKKIEDLASITTDTSPNLADNVDSTVGMSAGLGAAGLAGGIAANRHLDNKLARKATEAKLLSDLDKIKGKTDPRSIKSRAILEAALNKPITNKVTITPDMKKRISELKRTTLSDFIDKKIPKQHMFRRRALRYGAPIAGILAPFAPYALNSASEGAGTAAAQAAGGSAAAYGVNKAIDSISNSNKINNYLNKAKKIPGVSKITPALSKITKYRKPGLMGLAAGLPALNYLLSSGNNEQASIDNPYK